MSHGGDWGSRRAGLTFTPEQSEQFDRIAPKALALNLAYPAQITAPSKKSPLWTARSDAQKRPLRETVRFDAAGDIVARETFADRPFLDRLIGYGVAIHEGQMFGGLNQALGVFTGLGLIAVVVSGFVMWLKRRPAGKLGAPARRLQGGPGWGLLVTLVITGLLLPLLGGSLLLVLALDRWVFPRIPGFSRFMGLAPA